LPSELGALKVFKLRDDQQQSLQRLEQEVRILEQNLPGLPKLLDFNIKERWMVTEYFPKKTLEHNYSKYQGKPALALKAFLTLVKTVAALHEKGIVHRDIKPANVFVREDDELVLGDFGIVFVPDQSVRLTRTNESVGPHDYMPPWAEVNGRLVDVHPNFDIYMLGKLLWCMVSGRLRLQRERFSRPENDVTVMFKNDPAAHMINDVLEQCVVEEPGQCRVSAGDLAIIVSTYVHMLERGGQIWRDGIPKPCRICGQGTYQPNTVPDAAIRLWTGSSETVSFGIRLFLCDACGHVEFFRR
jgi:serine/threonine protein kinase